MSGLFGLAGWMWSPHLVGWGRPGPTPTREMLGYSAERLDDKKGKLSAKQVERQTVKVWDIPGIYALYNGRALVYVGQATKLGDRLLAHYRVDHLVGRWDTFSWASPASIVVKGGQNGSPKRLDVAPAPDKTRRVALKTFINEMEAFAIFVGNPIENRQEPNLGDHTWWLEQVKSAYADTTTDEMITALYAKLVNPE